VATPQAGRGFFGLMALLGTYVGIVPMLRLVGRRRSEGAADLPAGAGGRPVHT